MITFWEDDAWLGPKDLALAMIAMERAPAHPAPAVLEVGVWEGGWILHVAKNCGLRSVTGIDPYPGLEQKRADTLRRLDRHGVDLRLRRDWNGLPEEERYFLVHVDGEHSEEAALRDLTEAARRLEPSGLIMVDDWMQTAFIGVNSAVHTFLRAEDFRIVVATEWKAYLAPRSTAVGWAEHFRARLATIPEIPVDDADPAGLGAYVERREVLGFPVVTCLGKPSRSLKGRTADESPGGIRSVARRARGLAARLFRGG